MLFKILMRVGGALVVGLLLLLRACVVGSALYHPYHAASHANAGFNSPPQGSYRNATLAAAADSSGWMLFNTNDPQTGVRTRHARLTAASSIIIDGRPAPPNILELLEQGPNDHHIRLTLQAPATCPGITSVHAMFGTVPATIAVKSLDHEAGCTMDLLAYAAIVQSLRDADIMTVSAGDGPQICFAVAGLSWD